MKFEGLVDSGVFIPCVMVENDRPIHASVAGLSTIDHIMGGMHMQEKRGQAGYGAGDSDTGGEEICMTLKSFWAIRWPSMFNRNS